MIVEAKMNSQNRKTSKYLAAVMFTNFGANDPTLAQAFGSWPGDDDCRLRIMVVSVSEVKKSRRIMNCCADT